MYTNIEKITNIDKVLQSRLSSGITSTISVFKWTNTDTFLLPTVSKWNNIDKLEVLSGYKEMLSALVHIRNEKTTVGVTTFKSFVDVGSSVGISTYSCRP